MNTGVSWPDVASASARVLSMQTKLHQWAGTDPGRRFDDVFNLVHDPAFLVVAWSRVRGNKGARTAGVDMIAPRDVDADTVQDMLGDLRDALKARRFVPQMVREKAIPKSSGKVRRLGIPTTVDRIVQAALKLVLEPISRRISSRVPTVSARDAERRMRSPRSTSWPHPLATISGCSRRTSRRVSTRSRMQP